MTSRRSDRVRELFDEVADLEHGARVAYLEREEPDSGVRGEVLELVGFDDHPAGILDATVDALAGAAGAATPDVATYVGRRVGQYRIEGVLGHGGMGTVFLAKRDDIGLQVALKLVRGALADPGRLARFRQEAAVLARLNHPFIAQLVDAGVSDDGTPFLAMEYVRGSPINAWCEREHLDVARTLRLFAELCDAVSFAHQHLVVHRDIKPLNILVTPEGVVKLLDFGVAKLLDDDEESVQTSAGARLFSPEYASPEQVLGAPVTMATDVHGLGVLLFKLLTGTRPFGAAGAKQADVLAAVLRDDPPRASSLMRSKPSSVADLDAICFRALAKAPGDRYATVAALAEDVRNYLAGLPVRARLPTLRYRAGKFVRRNSVTVAIGTLIGALFVSAAGVFAWRVNEARVALTQAQQVSTFLLDVFKTTDPVETRGTDAPMKSYLDLAQVYMDGLDAQPATQARMLTILSEAYVGLGEYRKADSLATRALEQLKILGTGHDAEVSAGLVARGNARFDLGDQKSATDAFRTALALQREVRGDGHRETTETMLRLAEALASQGEMEEAEELAREALAARLVEPDHRNEGVADATMRLGRVLGQRGGDDLLEAERLLRASLSIREELYRADDFRIDRSLTPLALYLVERGIGMEAEQLARRALALRRTAYGADHPRTVAALNNLASTILVQRRVLEARTMYQQVVRQYQQAFGGDHLMLAVAIKNVASTFIQARQLDSAEVHLARALAMRMRLEGAGDADVALLRYELGELQRSAGRLDRAEASFRESYVQLERALGADNPATLRAASLLGGVLVSRGKNEEAERVLRGVVARQAQVLGERNAELARSLSFLATSQTKRNDLTNALPVHIKALQMARFTMATWDAARVEIVGALMAHHRASGRPELAERLQQEEAGVASVAAPAHVTPPPIRRP
jgi:tetratricopeptide (TPR) repeat protein